MKSQDRPASDPIESVEDLAPGALFHTAKRAEALVAGGSPDEVARAEKILAVILDCQEKRPGAARYGNFLWMREDPFLRDPNAVEFVLKYLIPMMIRHENRLTCAMRERVREGIRAGLAEIQALDVAVTYTNVAAMDCMNSCLGGEFFQDPALARRGYEKLRRLSDLTAANGTVFEFNSPSYLVVTLEALHRLAELVRHAETRIRARAMAARLGLSMALHIHQTTGHLAGPHSRAYHANVVCAAEPEIIVLRRLIEDGALPPWVRRVLQIPVTPTQIVEAAHRKWRLGSTAFHTPSFAMGTASREISWQTDVFTIHYDIPGEDRPGVVYSRYLLDDIWFASDGRVGDRTGPRNLVEAGKFYGVQDGLRAIGLYAPRTLEHFGSLAPCSRDAFESAKAAIIWSRGDRVDEIWAGDRRISTLPAAVAQGEVVVVASGSVYVAILPLARTDLGCSAPIRLVEVEGELLLEMYNYLGPRKNHSVLERRSRFYRGQPQCGFYAEVAERSRYADGKAFANTVVRGVLSDNAPPPFTAYMERAERPWTVEYARDGEVLGIEINLMEWELNRRWTHEGELGWPMLESPVARQNAEGRIAVGDAVLTCGKAPAWLFAHPHRDLYVVGYHGAPGPLRLEMPGDTVEIDTMGIGTVVWDRGEVTIEQ